MSREVELPRRPLVPVAFYALLAVVAAERACLRAGWGDVPASLAVAVLGSGLVALVAWRRRDLAAMGFVAAVAIPALVGVLVASAAMDAGRHLEGALSSSAVSGWRFEATSDSSFNNGQYRCRARVRRDGCPSGTVWVTLKEEVQRYVKEYKAAHKDQRDEYLDLEWRPGEMQVDFGQADFRVVGVRKRLHDLVCDFPFSNVGLAQVFPGETAECVCEGLMAVFRYIGGVPTRIVFDNATGVGRRICGEIRTSSLFAAFAEHFGFDYSFCNPRSGWEKGGVENKVGALRRSLFVPVPSFDRIELYNKRLLDECMRHSDKEHYRRGEGQLALFEEDCFALRPLP